MYHIYIYIYIDVLCCQLEADDTAIDEADARSLRIGVRCVLLERRTTSYDALVPCFESRFRFGLVHGMT
jgi:hypothetical protein